MAKTSLLKKAQEEHLEREVGPARRGTGPRRVGTGVFKTGLYTVIQMGVDWQFRLTFASYIATSSIAHAFTIIQTVIIRLMYV